MKTKLQPIDRRCGTVKGVLSHSKEVEVFDIDNKPVRTFGSVREMELKSEKYFGVSIKATKIRLHCKNEKPFNGRWFFRMKENYIF